jgi:hypothetical protein
VAINALPVVGAIGLRAVAVVPAVAVVVAAHMLSSHHKRRER